MINYKVLSKYVKNIKFNIPNPKIFYSLSENISNYKINIDIKSNQFKEKLVEIETSLRLKTSKEAQEKIDAEIVYSSIVELNGDMSNKKELEEIILIKVPNEVYPEIRKTFIFLFEQSGFKDIKIDENVDFKKLYKEKIN
ncbi:MAG: protein-export chaperone SecB [Pelagibacteraceae bacterium]